MFYLVFAFFFLLYMLAGVFTPLELTPLGMSLSIALIIGNLYMFVKKRKEAKSHDSSPGN
ncbi:hypothetical protein ACFQIC_09300 [Halobacillus seohaensis]|uniref:Uncharacterized protein n=1 Tax=Halobacillus seohaensis TaxID=447421 RepID=A0ABW2EI96_9BACI